MSSVVGTPHAAGALTGDPLSTFSTGQLKAAMAECERTSEQGLLDQAAVRAVSADRCKLHLNTVAVQGHTLYLDVVIDGVPVEAMVDSCSEITIISRSMLHEIGRQHHKEGRPCPTLSSPSLALYGKSESQLRVTAQLTVTITADGKSLDVPVFVQPECNQKCLLGMNICPALGLTFKDSKGQPLREHGAQKDCKVYLLQSCLIPQRAGKFVKARVEPIHDSIEILLEPGPNLNERSLFAPESFLTASPDGTVMIPVQNFGNIKIAFTEGDELGTVKGLVDTSRLPRAEELEHRLSAAVSTIPSESRRSLLEPLLNLECDDLPLGDQAKLRDLFLQSHALFALDDGELGYTSVVQHHINTEGHHPMRRTPFVQREQIAQMIQRMRTQGIVRPSTSPWSSPIVLVPKKGSTTRFCVDYRQLNSITKKDVYPLPTIDDILDTLGGCRCFLSLDLSSGY